jgi:hypothetical protein
MKPTFTGILLIGVATLLAGCFATTFTYSNRAPARMKTEDRTFFLRGAINANEPIRAYEVCPEGVASVEVIHTFVDSALGCVTLWIYHPNTVRVTCQVGTAHNFYLNENDEVVARQSFDEEGNLLTETVTVSSDVL